MRAGLFAGLAVVAAVTLTACDRSMSDPAQESTSGCVGPGGDGIKMATGHVYNLADGVDAALASSGMDAEPPSVSIDLINVSEAQRDAAADLQVGSTFEAGSTTYQVTMICAHVVGVEKAQ